MLKKNVKKVNQTGMDITYQDLLDVLNGHKASLLSRASDVIIKSGVVNIYPDGPDKERAKEEAETAKFALLCSVAAYDSALAEIRGFYTRNADKLSQTKGIYPNNLLTSHAVIELAYKQFYNS